VRTAIGLGLLVSLISKYWWLGLLILLLVWVLIGARKR
jgi:hypothetical protein